MYTLGAVPSTTANARTLVSQVNGPLSQALGPVVGILPSWLRSALQSNPLGMLLRIFPKGGTAKVVQELGGTARMPGAEKLPLPVRNLADRIWVIKSYLEMWRSRPAAVLSLITTKFRPPKGVTLPQFSWKEFVDNVARIAHPPGVYPPVPNSPPPGWQWSWPPLSGVGRYVLGQSYLGSGSYHLGADEGGGSQVPTGESEPVIAEETQPPVDTPSTTGGQDGGGKPPREGDNAPPPTGPIATVLIAALPFMAQFLAGVLMVGSQTTSQFGPPGTQWNQQNQPPPPPPSDSPPLPPLLPIALLLGGLALVLTKKKKSAA